MYSSILVCILRLYYNYVMLARRGLLYESMMAARADTGACKMQTLIDIEPRAKL